LAEKIATHTPHIETAAQTPPSKASFQQYLFAEIGERNHSCMPGNVATAKK
jgi:hypothetical protein